jgi:hypothetical protein
MVDHPDPRPTVDERVAGHIARVEADLARLRAVPAATTEGGPSMSEEAAGGNGRRIPHLAQMRAQTPPVNPVEAMRKSLALALFGGVSEADVQALAVKLKDMAMQGDLKATKLLLDLILPKEQKPAAQAADSAVGGQIADVLRDLVDEIRIGRATQAPRQALSQEDGL